MNETIKSIADIESIEQIPLEQRQLPVSTYDAIRLAAEANPSALAIRFVENGDVWKSALDKNERELSLDLTYSELMDGINRSANLFRSLGVKNNDVVSLVMPNMPQTQFALWGAEACGIANPINYYLEAEEIGAIVQSAGSKVLVVMGVHPDLNIVEKVSTIRDHAACLESILVVGDIPKDIQGCLDFNALLKEQKGSGLDFDRQFSAENVASLFHTGGTTGLPKLARHSHLNEVYTAWAINKHLKAKTDDVFLVGLPMFHCNAAIASSLLSFMTGATVLLAGISGYRGSGIVNNMFALVQYYRVSNFTGVPTIYAALSQMPTEGYDLSSVRRAGCGAAPMPLELFNKFEKVTGIAVCEGYGLTEATVASTMCPPEADAPRIGSIGLRLPYTRVIAAVVDGDGNLERECAIDEVGTVLISGPQVTPGYTDESKNASLFVIDSDGTQWLNTGDLARQDADGYFWLTGRSKELIIRGGHNIDPKVIEEALAKHPAVNLAAAIGRPDTYAGEVPVAYVDTVEAVTEKDLLDFCQQHIGERAAIPKAISVLDSLPVTGVGKIHKPTLHLMELKTVVEAELDALGDKVSSYEVLAEIDPKMGNTAQITIRCADGVDRSSFETELRELFGSYSFVFNLRLLSSS